VKKKAVTKKNGSASVEMRVEWMRLADVPRFDKNPRVHDLDKIEKSIQAYGFVSPLLLDEKTGKLVAGHGRLEALESLRDQGEKPPKRVKTDGDGNWLVPVVRGIAFKDANEAAGYLISDNRVSEVGGWDESLLRELVTDLREVEFDTSALGWSEQALDKLLAADSKESSSQKLNLSSGAGGDDLGVGQDGMRLVPIYLDKASYQPTVERMRAAMDERKLPDYTALLLFLLDHYEVGSRLAAKINAAAGADPFDAPSAQA
jgi:hypothetical protein